MKPSSTLRDYLLASSALLSVQSALTTSYYWDADGSGSVTTGGTGNWDRTYPTPKDGKGNPYAKYKDETG